MATAIRVVGNKEGNGIGNEACMGQKSNGDDGKSNGDEGDGLAMAAMAMATATAMM